MKWLQEEKRCIQQPWVSWALWLCCPCPQWPARCQALSAKCCSMLELLSPPAVPAVNPPIWYRSCDFSELSRIPGISIPGKEEKKGKIKDTGCGGWGGARPGFTIYCSFQSVITAGSSTTMDAPMLPMPAPLCLVTNKDSVLSLDRRALAVLRSVTQPLVVVAIAGLYRTGKSYLMNQLAQKRTGFPLGPTVHAETKGIWMWCLPHPRRQGVTLVLLDTEGLGDPKKDDDDSDAWIFTLAVLLSSTLVYNSIGTIDQRALEQLRLVTELTEHIRVREENDNPTSNFVRVFPCFVWTVRDFTLQLRALSEDEYLDDILRLQTGDGKKAKERNELRSCLRNFFPRRKLFTMERPAADADLQRLEELREDELQPGFRKQVDAFCRYIWEEAPVKVLLGGHQVTGSVLAGLAEKYVAAITSGAVPCVESAVTALARAENSAAVEAAVAEYQRGMEHGLVLPTASRSALVAVHRDCEQRAITLFLSRAFADHERQYHAELVGKLEAAKDEFCRRNEEASEQRCHAVLQELWRDVELRLQNGDYVAPGGAQLFKEDLNRVLEEYKRRPDKGVRAEAVLEVFLREREGLAQVLKATEVQLELAERQREAAAAEAEAAQKAAEAWLEEQRRTMEEHKRQLEQQLKEEQRAWLEEQWRVLEHHKKEYEALVQEGFKREAAAMQELITQLEEEKKNRKRDTRISSALSILAAFLPGAAGKLFNKLRPM
ncbi:guanylate-binding protein 1-like isoform X2 [Lagopus muta]|uniref:guanylate-binding protein 1-like isoform X2 n=1 Tax=Lagopus muta TaxID=64668 RepID=UPI0020A01B7E|nr:guanylate-binding protein 1-like isoform X2 [Lagopus muta]XP_048813333.1 guanylate-binding protein 1-like isoform X2 [Lagopus muta]